MKRLDDIRGPSQKIQQQPRWRDRQPSRQPQISKPVPSILSRRPSKLIFKLLNIFPKRSKILLLIVLAIFVGIALSTVSLINKEKAAESDHQISEAEKLKQVVIKEDTKLAVDFTFNLKMVINNQPQAISANYNKKGEEKFIFNTDTSDGDIHVQSPEKNKYTLHDFFVLWGGQFNNSCLLNHCLGGSGSLTMTVNGKINQDFQNYVIKPDDQIVITYNDLPLP
jgi:hypothetical protein